MSFEPEPLQRLLLWRLAVSKDGGEFLQDIKPEVRSHVRQPLVREKLIEESKQKPAGAKQPRKYLKLTDKGWTWCQNNLGAELTSRSRLGTPVLQRLLSLLRNYFENQESTVSFGQFVQQARPRNPVAASTSPGDNGHTEGLEELIRQACLELGQGQENVRVRLADLRARLRETATATLDETLLEMERQGALSLWPLDNPQEIRSEDRRAAIQTPAGNERHILYFGGRTA